MLNIIGTNINKPKQKTEKGLRAVTSTSSSVNNHASSNQSRLDHVCFPRKTSVVEIFLGIVIS